MPGPSPNPDLDICCCCGTLCEPQPSVPAGWPLHFCIGCRKILGPAKVVELQLLAHAGEGWRRFVDRFVEALDDDRSGSGGGMPNGGFSRN